MIIAEMKERYGQNVYSVNRRSDGHYQVARYPGNDMGDPEYMASGTVGPLNVALSDLCNRCGQIAKTSAYRERMTADERLTFDGYISSLSGEV